MDKTDDETCGQQHSSSGEGLTFADFPPRYLDGGAGAPKYETFGALMQRANHWLKARPHLEVKTCESYEMKSGRGLLDKETMVYHEPGSSCTYCYRGLRLWLVPRAERERPPQQLGFTNIIPKALGGSDDHQIFETLDQMVQRFNVTSKVNPLPGRVLTVESQDILTRNFVLLDPDVSYFEERSETSRHFLIILRVFYEVTNEPKLEEIGLLDFVPAKASDARPKSPVPSDFEPFSLVVARASRWCSEQNSIRYCNAQSLELKLRGGHQVETKRMSYTEHSRSTTNYIRILRVAYVKLPVEPSLVAPAMRLTCKTFVPYQATSGVLEFDSLTQTRRRVESWCKQAGARVVSCETSAMRLKTGGEASLGVEASFTFNIGQYDEFWMFVIRLYLDGDFVESPCQRRYSVRSFMSPPVVEEEQCCVIL